MSRRQFAERLVDVLAVCSEDSSKWPADLRADCALIHSQFEALKLDMEPSEAWRQSKAEWVKSALKESGLTRIVYHFRDTTRPR